MPADREPSRRVIGDAVVDEGLDAVVVGAADASVVDEAPCTVEQPLTTMAAHTNAI
jgi:hypothetical protein